MDRNRGDRGDGGRAPPPRARTLADDGIYPNNARLPLLVYQGVLDLEGSDPASGVVSRFAANGWGNAWRNGVYGYHHYHSTAHEALGVYAGTATVQFGGEDGVELSVQAGDVVVIPAGVAHKNLRASDGFRVVGAYPRGQRPDMNDGRAGERPRADRNIERVALPEADPVFGPGGPLVTLWGDERGARSG